MRSDGLNQTHTFTGESLAAAVEDLLESLTVTEATHPDPRHTFLLGYAAEAVDVGTVIQKAAAHISALVSDHEATVVHCEVSGMQQTDEGHRLWGTIECVPSARRAPGQTVAQVRGIEVEQKAPLMWRLTVHLAWEERS